MPIEKNHPSFVNNNKCYLQIATIVWGRWKLQLIRCSENWMYLLQFWKWPFWVTLFWKWILIIILIDAPLLVMKSWSLAWGQPVVRAYWYLHWCTYRHNCRESSWAVWGFTVGLWWICFAVTAKMGKRYLAVVKQNEIHLIHFKVNHLIIFYQLATKKYFQSFQGNPLFSFWLHWFLCLPSQPMKLVISKKKSLQLR